MHNWHFFSALFFILMLLIWTVHVLGWEGGSERDDFWVGR